MVTRNSLKKAIAVGWKKLEEQIIKASKHEKKLKQKQQEKNCGRVKNKSVSDRKTFLTKKIYSVREIVTQNCKFWILKEWKKFGESRRWQVSLFVVRPSVRPSVRRGLQNFFFIFRQPNSRARGTRLLPSALVWLGLRPRCARKVRSCFQKCGTLLCQYSKVLFLPIEKKFYCATAHCATPVRRAQKIGV